MPTTRASGERFRLGVGACTVEIEALGPRWVRAASALAFAWRQEEGGPAAGRICLGFDPGPPPPGAAQLLDDDVRLWTTAPAPYLIARGVHIRMADSETVIVDGHATSARLALDTALPASLGWILAGAGRWVVHAAALVPGSDVGAVLALGDTGAGKSTTAAAALHAGWPVLADDLVVLRCGENGAEARGIPKSLWIPEELGTVRSGGIAAAVDAIRGRREIKTALARGWFPIRAVIVLAHGDAPDTTVERIDAIEAMRSLWSAHIPASIPSRLERWFPVAGRLARLPAWRMSLGAKAASRLSTTAQALATLTASASG